MLTNQTLFDLAFLNFYKQAKRKKIKEKPPLFFRSFLLAYTL
ncbi:hypothetical protein HPHPH3_1354 [Helicobacter pylori Hp H-3]|nr:hypothetical protein HPHPH3_1354 [Helicobacter pylori Hp H-3]